MEESGGETGMMDPRKNKARRAVAGVIAILLIVIMVVSMLSSIWM